MGSKTMNAVLMLFATEGCNVVPDGIRGLTPLENILVGREIESEYASIQAALNLAETPGVESLWGFDGTDVSQNRELYKGAFDLHRSLLNRFRSGMIVAGSEEAFLALNDVARFGYTDAELADAAGAAIGAATFTQNDDFIMLHQVNGTVTFGDGTLHHEENHYFNGVEHAGPPSGDRDVFIEDIIDEQDGCYLVSELVRSGDNMREPVTHIDDFEGKYATVKSHIDSGLWTPQEAYDSVKEEQAGYVVLQEQFTIDAFGSDPAQDLLIAKGLSSEAFTGFLDANMDLLAAETIEFYDRILTTLLAEYPGQISS